MLDFVREIRASLKPLDPYLKTSRAKEHLDALQRELDAFYESKPYRFTREDDLQKGRQIIRCEIKQTPDRITLIAGDLFYNLRASLDQLTWCLAKGDTVPSYPLKTAFPILDEPDDRQIARKTKGISGEAIAIIKSLQPYNARDEATMKLTHLWRLNKLCNIDKHIRIPVYGQAGKFWLPQSIAQRGIWFQALDKRYEMHLPLELKSEMALDPRITMKVIFGDVYWGVECDFEDLAALYDFVTNTVIPKFSRFLK
jgi:hypothetical protein